MRRLAYGHALVLEDGVAKLVDELGGDGRPLAQVDAIVVVELGVGEERVHLQMGV